MLVSRWSTFNFSGVVNWFPGHMFKSSRHVAAALSLVDVVFEMRDARIPLSSTNSVIDELLAKRPQQKRVVVLNKADLANHRTFDKTLRYFENRNIKAYLSSTVAKSGATSLKRVIPRIIEDLELREGSKPALMTLILGLPNAGKSSFINALRQNSARRSHAPAKFLSKATTGKRAGVTRVLTAFDIWERPSIKLIDTPGIMVPRVTNLQQGLNLALVGAVRDNIVPNEVLADYVLYVISKNGLSKKQWEVLGFSKAHDSIEEALADMTSDGFEEGAACTHIIKMFREGKLGLFTIDDLDGVDVGR